MMSIIIVHSKFIHYYYCLAGAITAGILVPLAVIVFIAIGIASFFYYRKRQQSGRE